MATVVDAVNFTKDYYEAKDLQEVGESLGEDDQRSVADLLVDQVEFADIILIGDFNEDPDEQNINHLTKIGIESLMVSMLGQPKVGTYVYRGKDYFYDQILINKGLKDQKYLSVDLESLYILDIPKYRQQEGNYAHFPFRFGAGNRLLGGYSDHLAIKVEIIAQ